MAHYQHARHLRDYVEDLGKMDRQCERWLGNPPSAAIERRLMVCRQSIAHLQEEFSAIVAQVGTRKPE